MTDFILPEYQDIEAAAARLADYAHRTPVLTSTTANARCGGQLYFKCENLQRMGAFKFRGAMNALLQFTPQQKRDGVIAFSSGNHAQGIALAAQILQIPATIVMPEDAPQAKVEATRGYGGRIVRYDRYTQDREQLCREIAEREGLTLIPPYDHPAIVAGQGTAVRELLMETGPLDVLYVPVGGGGLLSGSALAARHLAPECRIYGVEPEAGNDGQQSLRSGKLVQIATPRTLADGAQNQMLGQHITFPLIQRLVDDILTVSDDGLVAAMRFFAERMKMVVEPTGCLAFAAAMAQGDALRAKRVGIVVSGGNVDITRYAQLLAENQNG